MFLSSQVHTYLFPWLFINFTLISSIFFNENRKFSKEKLSKDLREPPGVTYSGFLWVSYSWVGYSKGTYSSCFFEKLSSLSKLLWVTYSHLQLDFYRYFYTALVFCSILWFLSLSNSISRSVRLKMSIDLVKIQVLV